MKQLKPLLWIAFACVSFTSMAQAAGINWTKGLSFEQIKQKAKQENKYIFIDCYTTWCTFCKKMDGEAYVLPDVGNFYNEKFISVKVQFDQTAADSAEVKAWYEDAKSISNQYMIEGYPTFIFLSPEGKIVHKEAGYKTSDQFIALGKLALEPGRTFNDDRALYNQYMEEYKAGKKNYEHYPLMIRIAEKVDQDTRRTLTRELADHMVTLPREKRYTEEIIKLWESHVFNPKHAVVKFYREDADLIDKIMDFKGYSASRLDATVQAVVVTPFFEAAGVSMGNEPVMMLNGQVVKDGDANKAEADWKKLEQAIAEQYGKEIVDRAMFSARVEWYSKHKNDDKALEYSLKKLKQYPPNMKKEWYSLNSIGWDAFLGSTNMKALKECADWMEKVVTDHPKSTDCLDTYAQLLYKIGQKEKAIEWETKAADLTPGRDDYKNVVKDMKSNYPTYGANWEGINHITWDGFKFKKVVFTKTADKKMLPNVTVTNKRTNETKTTTETKGVLLEVMLGDVLVVSCPGYVTQELKITKKPGFFDLVMKPGN